MGIEAAASYAVGRLSSLAADRFHAAEEEMFGKLLSFPKHYVSILLNLDDQIRLLRRILPELKELILNAEVKPETKDLYGVFRSFSEDAEDILDTYDSVRARHRHRLVAHPQPNRFKTLLNLVCSCLPCSACFDFFDYESVPLHFYKKIAERITSFYDELGEEDIPVVDRAHSFFTSAKDVLRVMSDRTTKMQFEREITGGLLRRGIRVVGIQGVEKKVIHDEITFLRKSLPELKKLILNAYVQREEIEDWHEPFEVIAKAAEDILGEFDTEIAERHLNVAADQQPNRFKTFLKLACGCVPFSCFDSSDYGQVSHTCYVMISYRMKVFYDELEELRNEVDFQYLYWAAVKDALRHIGDRTTEKQVDREITGEKLGRCFRLAVREGVKKKVTYEETVFLRKNILPKLKKLVLKEEAILKLNEERERDTFTEKAKDILDDLDRLATLGHQDPLPWSSIFSPFFLNLRTASHIKGLWGGLELLKSNENKAGQFIASAAEALRVVRGQTAEAVRMPRRTDELLSKDFHFVGREKIKEKVMAELTSEPLSKPSVVLITGMGGIGKTTLVQDILRTPDFDRQFQIKKWVFVGGELDPKAAIAKIFGRTIEERSEICEELKDKRFLIVLDDCWKGRLEGWKELWEPLTHGRPGSKVIITSREDISTELELASVIPYQLDVLSDEECLQIFESYAFGSGGVPSTSRGWDSTSRLREIGKEFVNKNIRGLPLTARILGSSLSRTRQVDEWNNVLKGIAHKDIMSALMWSYNRLPSNLKQCFSYLSLFPKGHELEKEEVVWMWIAHGFIEKRENLTLESIGKIHFDDLVTYSLVQNIHGYYGRENYYNMHDIVHDLAIIVYRGGYFSNNGVLNENYITSSNFLIEDNSSANKIKKLRTLLHYGGLVDISKFQLQYVRAISLLRHQDIIQINLGKMICLRYLDLTGVRSSSVPESICGIYNLQTLRLCDEVTNFPLGVWNLPNLRHLKGGRGIRMTGISNSTSLQTIDNFNLFFEEDIEELRNLKELRGRLKINHLNHVQSPRSASKAELKNKEYIEELVLQWGDSRDNEECTWMRSTRQNDILENLCPHESLRFLEIDKYMGDRSPSWMRGEYLSKIAYLRLSELPRLKELPPLGHLPKLECLYIHDLRNIRCISNEVDGTQAVIFPSLKKLHLKNMDALAEWMESSYHKDQITKWFPSLEYLRIAECMQLRRLPRLPRRLKWLFIDSTGLKVLPEIWTCIDDSDIYDLPCLEELQIHGCPSLRPDGWFQKYRMPCLSKLTLSSVGGCTDLVVNYSRQCLSYLSIENMPTLRSITLSKLVSSEEFREAAYQELSISLRRLHVLKYMSRINCEEEKIIVGSCNPASMLQENESKFMMITDVNRLSTDNWEILLRVDPRKLVQLDLLLLWDLDLGVPYDYQRRLRRWFLNLTSLQELEITAFPYREREIQNPWPHYLPLHNLCSLKSIKFLSCGSALESFPVLPLSFNTEGLQSPTFKFFIWDRERDAN